MKKVGFLLLLVVVGCATTAPLKEQPQIILSAQASKAKTFTALISKLQAKGFTFDISTLEGGMIQTSWRDASSTFAAIMGNRTAYRFQFTLAGDSSQTTIRATGQTRAADSGYGSVSGSVTISSMGTRDDGWKDLEKITNDAKALAEAK